MYYAVRKGHITGIFDNWPEAQAATLGFSGPELWTLLLFCNTENWGLGDFIRNGWKGLFGTFSYLDTCSVLLEQH